RRTPSLPPALPGRFSDRRAGNLSKPDVALDVRISRAHCYLPSGARLRACHRNGEGAGLRDGDQLPRANPGGGQRDVVECQDRIVPWMRVARGSAVGYERLAEVGRNKAKAFDPNVATVGKAG